MIYLIENGTEYVRCKTAFLSIIQTKNLLYKFTTDLYLYTFGFKTFKYVFGTAYIVTTPAALNLGTIGWFITLQEGQ